MELSMRGGDSGRPKGGLVLTSAAKSDKPMRTGQWSVSNRYTSGNRGRVKPAHDYSGLGEHEWGGDVREMISEARHDGIPRVGAGGALSASDSPGKTRPGLRGGVKNRSLKEMEAHVERGGGKVVNLSTLTPPGEQMESRVKLWGDEPALFEVSTTTYHYYVKPEPYLQLN